MIGNLPDPAQWTVSLFWSQIQWVANQGQRIKARLDAQKLRLQQAYTAARNANDQEKMAKLQPLIHRNSELRVQYRDLATRFNDVIEDARVWLGQHGFNEPPTLAGLGVVLPAIPVIYVVGLIGVIGLVLAITAAINAVDKALSDLGEGGATAISFAVLAAVGVGAYLLLVKPGRATA